jgi:hypothetical protein
MEKQTMEQMNEEVKKEKIDFDKMSAVELVRELRKDPRAVEEARRVAAM